MAAIHSEARNSQVPEKSPLFWLYDAWVVFMQAGRQADAIADTVLNLDSSRSFLFNLCASSIMWLMAAAENAAREKNLWTQIENDWLLSFQLKVVSDRPLAAAPRHAS